MEKKLQLSKDTSVYQVGQMFEQIGKAMQDIEASFLWDIRATADQGAEFLEACQKLYDTCHKYQEVYREYGAKILREYEESYIQIDRKIRDIQKQVERVHDNFKFTNDLSHKCEQLHQVLQLAERLSLMDDTKFDRVISLAKALK